MKKLIKLTLCLLSLYLFVAIVVPYINSLPFFAPIQEVIKKWDIDSSVFFYTADISTNSEITKHTDL